MCEEIKIKIRVHLDIFSNTLSPDAITNLVGLTPDATWSTGELIHPRLVIKHKENGWRIDTGDKHGIDLSLYISEILERIKPVYSRIKKLVDEKRVEVELCCVLRMYSQSTPSIYITPDIIKYIHELNATIDIDMYIIHEDSDWTSKE